MSIELGPAANADWAVRTLERIRELSRETFVRLEHDPDLARTVVVVTGASEALGDQIVGHMALIDVLVDVDDPWSADVVAARARDAVAAGLADGGDETDARAAEAMAGMQREGLLRIAARDMLGLADTPQIAEELADLADGLIVCAHGLAAEGAAGTDAELAVLAMGKLGGEELNYVSDVDVLFVHRGDTPTAERMAKRVLHLLGTHTPRGAVYEMDANLRPEGRNGPITRTIESYRAYYERWAKTWEFQSLLKMRPVAGPPDLGADFEQLVAPFLWPDSLGAEAVEEIQQMKRRVETSRPVTRDGSRQLKLAPGGLRDIEFATQLLQLVHGPADPSLRLRGTVPALAALAKGGYVDDGDAALFTDAYLFLRTVEHRLQLRQLRRTHTIPDDPGDLQRVARTMGFRDLPARSAAEEFSKELARVRTGVRRLHEQLFYRPLLSTLASYGVEERVVAAGRFDKDAAAARLAALSFSSPGQALRHLEAMVQGGGRTARQLRVVLPTMLQALSDQPDPDGGLAALRSLTDQLKDNPRFVRTIRDNPPAARLLAKVLGASPRLGEWLGRQPEVLQLLDDEEVLARPHTRDDVMGGVEGLLKRGGGRVSREALRRLKRREALRTAMRDVNGAADVPEIGRELTWLGEGLLHAALSTITPDEVRIAVIGMGRFGAGELAHSSDLDVIVVHDGPTPVAEHAMEEVLEFLSAVTPEGSAFRVDPDLRPEGRRGPLTRTLESYAAYYERWGQDWELQALTQARPVAGDAELGQAFMDLITPLVYPDPMPTERLVAIRTMKARVERERAGRKGVQPSRRTPRRRAATLRRDQVEIRARDASQRRSLPNASSSDDLKLGPGGLSDVEWTVQLLSMRHGGADPLVRGPGTLAGLERLAAAGILAPEEAAWLRNGWLLLSRLRNGLYLIKVRDTSTLPQNPEVLQKLAALMHYRSAQALTEDVDRARRRIRKVFDRRFFD
ncbi:MAG: bifunctional [glutamine synthetase] adenylyltransferase/[glutamine synthetase]-adenylyl-L-tyrosine phosphorylase [Actinomycetota bacterium]